MSPFYEGDRKKRARSYSVQGEIKLRIHDFSKIGPILEGAVEDQVSDFRSLTYSLSDEEAAKRQAVASGYAPSQGPSRCCVGAIGAKSRRTTVHECGLAANWWSREPRVRQAGTVFEVK